MTRLIDHDATGPRTLDAADIDEEKGDIAVCQCGLSDAFPFCDGTHRETLDEAAGTRYRYVEEGGELVRRQVDRIVLADADASE
jgi:CDGSH-type Zn-finger protein